MAGVVVPFRGTGGKSRLDTPLRERLALAMLADVLAACVEVAPTVLVTSDEEASSLADELGVDVVRDPGGGQGAAVAAGLAHFDGRPLLVLNADLPRARPRDLLTLFGTAPPGGMALVPARDGTTNALVLPDRLAFASLYGPGSAEGFRRHGEWLGLDVVVARIPNLVEDVDTMDDLGRPEGLGPRTRDALAPARPLS